VLLERGGVTTIRAMTFCACNPKMLLHTGNPTGEAGAS